MPWKGRGRGTAQQGPSTQGKHGVPSRGPTYLAVRLQQLHNGRRQARHLPREERKGVAVGGQPPRAPHPAGSSRGAAQREAGWVSEGCGAAQGCRVGVELRDCRRSRPLAPNRGHEGHPCLPRTDGGGRRVKGAAAHGRERPRRSLHTPCHGRPWEGRRGGCGAAGAREPCSKQAFTTNTASSPPVTPPPPPPPPPQYTP